MEFIVLLWSVRMAVDCDIVNEAIAWKQLMDMSSYYTAMSS